MIKEHESEDLKAKKIDPELVLEKPLKKPKLHH